jgi:hypothetical protein
MHDGDGKVRVIEIGRKAVMIQGHCQHRGSADVLTPLLAEFCVVWMPLDALDAAETVVPEL